jgi:hypothetical protein
MSILIHTSGQPQGPYPIEQVKAWLASGQVGATVMGSNNEGATWVPLHCLQEIRDDPSLATVVRSATSGDLEIEEKILQETINELERLIGTEATQRNEVWLQRKVRIFYKQVYSFQAQFPDSIEAKAYEASLYSAQARIVLSAAGFMRKESAKTSSVAWGLVTGVLANQQEKKSAMHSLPLFDKALGIFDNAGDRLAKAFVYQSLGQNENAIRELNHIAANFVGDPLYISARVLRDEIETP